MSDCTNALTENRQFGDSAHPWPPPTAYQTANGVGRAVNEHLGYRYGEVSIRVRAPLPLRVPA
jgi:hypothetical protein